MFPVSFVFILCFCGATIPGSSVSTEEYVDLIELNHFFDQKGQHVYDQVIFYERAPETGRFQVRAWCLVEDRDLLNRRPIKNVQNQLYYVDWEDREQHLMRKISSRLFRESWTQIDPERANKKILDERSRVSLIQSPKKFLASQRQEQSKQASQIQEVLISTESPPATSQIAGSAAVPMERAPSDSLVVR